MTNFSAKPVRVRFAPSPTGPMHIGGLRTAIFNWLFARHYNGTFILRVEDTDQSRYQEAAEDLIYNALDWVGITVDEGPRQGGDYGPYRQSERLAIYQQWARWLVENDKAYYDYTTSEELAAINEEKRARKEPPGYDRRHRDIDEATRAKLKAEGRPEVIRFKMPLDGTTVVKDMLRDDIVFDNSQLNDLVLLKSDGYPTYHLANVIDDHLMQISHIMRANEWIPTAPVHAQLYAAFGWEMPQIAHLPVMLNPNGKGKMSKRNPPVDDKGRVIPVLVTDYQEQGFLPEAMMNFLSNIGWSYGEDQEIYTPQEAIARFDGTRINPVNSAFPAEKLRWFNGVYIREKIAQDDLQARLKAVLVKAGYHVDDAKLTAIMPAIPTRIDTLNDVVGLTHFLFVEAFQPASAEEHIQKKMDAASTLKALEVAQTLLQDMDFDNPEVMDAPMRQAAADNDLKTGQFFGVLRVSLSAQTVAPPLFDTMKALGKTETLRRIQQSIDILRSHITP